MSLGWNVPDSLLLERRLLLLDMLHIDEGQTLKSLAKARTLVSVRLFFFDLWLIGFRKALCVSCYQILISGWYSSTIFIVDKKTVNLFREPKMV